MQRTKAPRTRELRSLTAAIVLAVITACLLLWVERTERLNDKADRPSGVEQVLIIVIGMSAVATLEAFQYFAQSGTQASVVRKAPSEKFKGDSRNAWNLSLEELREDKLLGLTRLEAEIELELRRITIARFYNKYKGHNRSAEYSEIVGGLDTLQAVPNHLRLINELVRKDILSVTLAQDLEEFISNYLKAHSKLEASDEVVATDLMDTGNSLLNRLRSEV